MSDVLAITMILALVFVSYPGLLLLYRLLFPERIAAAAGRLERSPGACFALGLALLGVFGLPGAALISLPAGPVKLAGWLWLGAGWLAVTLGAAGLAALLGRRIEAGAAAPLSPAGSFVRGALALELASAFPILGWLVVLPLLTCLSLGAALFAALKWAPAGRAASRPAPAALEQPGGRV
jgi:hypothetical protein